MEKVGIFVGRMCPIHKGHMRSIDYLIDNYGSDNSLIIIGSSNSPISFRVLFPYKDRSKWVKQLYPNMKIIGLPDSPGCDDDWFSMLDDYINAVFPNNNDITFIGGEDKDVEFFYNYGRKVHILDRNGFHCSGTNIRQLLLQEEDISKFVDSKIIDDIKDKFRIRLKELDELR